jgi:hypothetical protein
MFYLEQFLGIGFLFLGLVSISTYSEDLASFRLPWCYRELKPMQARWGKTTGTILHVVGYVVAPVGFGILFLTGMVFQ